MSETERACLNELARITPQWRAAVHAEDRDTETAVMRRIDQLLDHLNDWRRTHAQACAATV